MSERLKVAWRKLTLFTWSLGIGTKMNRKQRNRIKDLLRHRGVADTKIAKYGPYQVVADIPFVHLQNICDGSPESVRTGKFGGH